VEKKRSVGVAVILLLALPLICFAEIVVLKSGKTIEEKIIEKADDYVRVEIAGEPVTYFLDEIESIEGESYQSVPRNEDNITASQSDTSPLSEDNNLEQQQVLGYINKSGSIIKGMNTEIAKKQTLLAQASMIKDMEKMHIVTKEMRDIIKQHKEQFLSLSIPPNCQPLYTAILNLLQLQEDIHNELIDGDMEKSNALTKQLPEVLNIMTQEVNRLIQHYGE
jgi:hypothetical protein